MANSPLRDPIEGGFFRYAVQRDWSEPHYERMLSDNAQLLTRYTARGPLAAATAAGIASFLLEVLRLPPESRASGAFASAQDSESRGQRKHQHEHIEAGASPGHYLWSDAVPGEQKSGQPVEWRWDS